jgi:hypothetical protein
VVDVVDQVQLKQRLLACISAVFIEHLHDSIMLQDKCCMLLDAESITCAVSNNLAGDVQVQQNQQDQHLEDDTRGHVLQAHLLVVLDVMQQLPSMPAEVMQQCCVKLMVWTMEAMGSPLGAALLSSDIGGPVLLHMWQTLLYCLVSCGSTAPQQQGEMLRIVQQLGEQHTLACLPGPALPCLPLLCICTCQILIACFSNRKQRVQLTAAGVHCSVLHLAG